MRGISSPILVAAVVLSVPPARAGEKERRFRWTGDALARFEAVRGAPNPETAEFERARLRIRPGAEWTMGASGRWFAGAGVRASVATDTNDDNRSRIDNFRSDEFALDRAYLRISGIERPVSGTIGVFEAPVAGTEIVWDRDLRFQGGSIGVEMAGDGGLLAHRMAGGVTVGSQDGEDGSVAAVVRWDGDLAAGWTLAGSYWHFDETEDLVAAGLTGTNRTSPVDGEYLSDFRVVNLTAGWEMLGERRPVRLRLDLLHNLGAEDRNDAVEARFDWGELIDRGSWRLRVALQRVEQDAVLAAFGGDEWWFRTAHRGVHAGFAVALDPRVVVELSALRQRRDDLDDWLDRVWIDLAVAF